MARMIDADELLADLILVLQELVENPYIQGRIIGCVSSQPTAYNVEKVVEELEELYVTDIDILQDMAIEIVRKGGVE